MKGALDGINRLHNTEENMSKCEETAIRLPKMKGTKRKKKETRTPNSVTDLVELEGA